MLKSSRSAIFSFSATAGFSTFLFKRGCVDNIGLANTDDGLGGGPGRENHFLETAYSERVRDRIERFNEEKDNSLTRDRLLPKPASGVGLGIQLFSSATAT